VAFNRGNDEITWQHCIFSMRQLMAKQQIEKRADEWKCVSSRIP
jgi:hypothetical protein